MLDRLYAIDLHLLIDLVAVKTDCVLLFGEFLDGDELEALRVDVLEDVCIE